MILAAAMGTDKIVAIIAIILVMIIALFFPRSALKLNINKVSRVRISYNGPEGDFFIALNVDDDHDIIYYLLENGYNITAMRRGKGKPAGGGWYNMEIYNNYDDKMKQLWFNETRIFYEWNIKGRGISKNKILGGKYTFDVEYYRELLDIPET